jgi:hypothetical protein
VIFASAHHTFQGSTPASGRDRATIRMRDIFRKVKNQKIAPDCKQIYFAMNCVENVSVIAGINICG